MAIKHTEADTLKACQDWLEANRYLYLRHNTVGLRREGGGFRKVRDSQKGGPDLIIFKRFLRKSDIISLALCEPIAVECKSAKGCLSSPQVSWYNRAAEIGLRYVVVREISDLVKVLED